MIAPFARVPLRPAATALRIYCSLIRNARKFPGIAEQNYRMAFARWQERIRLEGM